MIRWSYLLPRVAVVVAIWLAVQFGLPVVLRWTLIQSLQGATGAWVNIDKTWASLARGRMQVNDVQVARSKDSAENLVEFRTATLAVNLGALSRRQLVIDKAEIRGMAFGTPRRGEGLPGLKLDLSLPEMPNLQEYGRDLSRQWFDDVVRLLERRVEEEFESVRLARELAERWPAEYERLEVQVRTCRDSAERLHQLLSRPLTIPANGQEFAALQQRWEDVKRLRGEIDDLRARLEQLPRQVVADRAAIQTALSQDRAKLRDAMRLTRLSGEQLNSYLLDSETYQLWVQIRPWLRAVQWLRQSPEFEEKANRGTVVRFDADTPLPDFLIRSATLDGRVLINGHDFRFSGTAEDLTKDQKRWGRPTRIHVATDGPFRASINAELDVTGDVPRQSLSFHCADLPRAGRTFGSAETLVVGVAPGRAEVRVAVAVEGDRLTGRVFASEKQIQLTAAVGPDLGPPELRELVASVFHDVDALEMTIDIGGTVTAPRWKIDSDFGPLLTARIQETFQRAVETHARQLAEEADRQIAAQMQRLEQLLDARHTNLTRQLGIGEQLLSSLSKPVASQIKPLEQMLRRF